MEFCCRAAQIRIKKISHRVAHEYEDSLFSAFLLSEDSHSINFIRFFELINYNRKCFQVLIFFKIFANSYNSKGNLGNTSTENICLKHQLFRILQRI